MLVDERGRIAQIAPAAAFASHADIERIDFGDAILLPGLINVHAHPELAMFRGFLDDLPFQDWIPALMRSKRNAQFTPDDYEAAARWTCVESLRAGITTMGATEDSGAAAAALAAAGMRGCVYLEVFGPAPEQADAAIAELKTKLAAQSRYASERVRLGVSPHAPYSVSDRLFERTAELARADALPLATHAAESEAEELLVGGAAGPFAAGLRNRGIAVQPRAESTIALLERTGVLARAPLLIHAVRASDADLRRIADSGAGIAHCPIANARLGHGIAPIVAARAAGITVGIGTDSVASNNRLDLLEEARVAQVLQRAVHRDPSALDSATLLRMITIDAAALLGIDGLVGTLEPGKDADFCALRLDRAHNVPVGDPLAAVFHSARGSDVIVTAVAGTILYDGDRVCTLDEAGLNERVRAAARRLQAAP